VKEHHTVKYHQTARLDEIRVQLTSSRNAANWVIDSSQNFVLLAKARAFGEIEEVKPTRVTTFFIKKTRSESG